MAVIRILKIINEQCKLWKDTKPHSDINPGYRHFIAVAIVSQTTTKPT